MTTYHYLYKITNLVTNKFYFGVHTTTDLDDGYLGSGVIIKRSVAKYGAAAHVKEIMQFYDTREQLMDAEKQIVNETILLDPQCMNLRCGGRGGFTIEQQRINNSRSQIAQRALRDTNPEWRDLVRTKRTQGLKQQYRDGIRQITVRPHVVGEFQHSSESKLKIAETMKGKACGSNNSQFGTCWIHNVEIRQNKKINKHELDEYISNGWIAGRKMKF